MSRIPRKVDRDSDEIFRREVRVQQADYDLNQREMADQSGIPQSTLSKRLKNPEDFTVGELRKLIQTMGLRPGAVLRLLWYSDKDIKKFIRESDLNSVSRAST